MACIRYNPYPHIRPITNQCGLNIDGSLVSVHRCHFELRLRGNKFTPVILLILKLNTHIQEGLLGLLRQVTNIELVLVAILIGNLELSPVSLTLDDEAIDFCFCYHNGLSPCLIEW